MIERRGDLWSGHDDLAGLVVITTNGDINSRGECVMGRGVAKQATERNPKIASHLARCIKLGGNRVYLLGRVVTFPVKHHWNQVADFDLIISSCVQLSELAEFMPWATFYMPRPGCGNGKLNWEDDVKPVIETLLTGTRFVVMEKFQL